MTTATPRRMRDADYRAQQYEQRYVEQIAPVNRLVDAFIEEDAGVGRGRWMPYVAPLYSTSARVLQVFRDPGPATQEGSGSGMLSLENDDRSAALVHDVVTTAGLPTVDLCPWNTYPWYINAKPSLAQLDEGGDLLIRLLGVLREVRVVVLHGGSAHQGWRRLEKRRPGVTRRYLSFETFHGSPQTFISRDLAVRAQRREHIYKTYRDIAASLG